MRNVIGDLRYFEESVHGNPSVRKKACTRDMETDIVTGLGFRGTGLEQYGNMRYYTFVMARNISNLET